MIKQYSRVKLTTDNYIVEGVKNGDIGYIIEIYEEINYEVEFSDPSTGITIAQVVVKENEIELAE